MNCFELKTNVTRKVGVNSAGGQELDAGNKSNEERIQYSPYCRVPVFVFFCELFTLLTFVNHNLGTLKQHFSISYFEHLEQP